MTHLGGGAELVGLMFGLSAMFELPAMRWSAPLVRRIGGPYALLIAYGCFATAYLGYAISPSPLVMIGFSVFRGLAFGLFYASTVHLVHEMAPKQWSSTLQAVMNALAFGLAQLISRPGSGAIYDSFGPSAAFVAAGGAVLVAMLIMGSTAIFTRRPSRPALSPAEPGM
jgi:MFS family permease